MSILTRTRAVRRLLLAGAALCIAPAAASAQDPQGEAKGDKDPKPYKLPPLYAADAPLELTLTAPFRQLRRDRKEENDWRQAHISYVSDSGRVEVPVRVRTRGIWRKKNCDIPPILLNFAKDSTKQTLFTRLDRVRLTLHCRDNDQYEQYVLQEYQLYRVQKQLTPYTFAVRLARMTYVDSEKNDTVAVRWGFLQEQDEDFAERLGVKLVEVQGAGPADLDPYESAFFGVFQYFVGNSDFSIRALHNAVLVLQEPWHVPVARDFDWSGAVNARYATPNPILRIKRVDERIMRGYCAPAAEYQKVFTLFRDRKDAIYGVYRDSIAAPMKEDVVKRTLKYFDDFYEIINNERLADRFIIGACLGGSA